MMFELRASVGPSGIATPVLSLDVAAHADRDIATALRTLADQVEAGDGYTRLVQDIERSRRGARPAAADRPSTEAAARVTERAPATDVMRRACRDATATGSVRVRGVTATIAGLVARGLAVAPRYGYGRDCDALITDEGCALGREVLDAEHRARRVEAGR